MRPSIGELFTTHFFLLALIVGTLIAIGCGLVGSLLVLRGELFTADALSHVAFTGAMAAFLVGISTGVGLVVSCIVAAVVLALLSRRPGSSDAVIGTSFAWILGLGTLALSLASSSGYGSSGATSTAVLFGSLFTISSVAAEVAIVLGSVVILGVITLGRPLVFSSLDPSVAAAKGVSATGLSIAFSALVGLVAALAVQSVGALLFVGLLAAPAGAALRLVRNPFATMAVASAIAVACMWAGTILAGLIPSIPPSAAIVLLAGLSYAAVAMTTTWKQRSHGY